MNWGMIARADMGGLGSQTLDIYRQMNPAKIMLVFVPDPRGRAYPGNYLGDVVCAQQDAHINKHEARKFCEGLDAVFTVETFYGDSFRQLPIKRKLMANPELFQDSDPEAEIMVPTHWAVSRMPARTGVLPQPVPLPELPRVRTRYEVRTFLHVAAPAMLDRNGTLSVLAACQRVDTDCSLIVHSPGRHSPEGRTHFKLGKVSVTWNDQYHENRWDAYDLEADCFILPRRYGGLCLPAQEAMACGLPLLMSDLSPQTTWPAWRFPHSWSIDTPMKGGTFPVHQFNEHVIGKAMSDALAAPREVVSSKSVASFRWAHEHSWDKLRSRWDRFLRC